MLVLLWLLVCFFGCGGGRVVSLHPLVNNEALVVCGTEPKTSCALGKQFTTDLHPQPSILKSVNDPVMSLLVVKLLCVPTAPACCSPEDGEALCLPSTLSLQIQFPSGLVLVGGGKQFMLLKYLWLNFCSSVDGCTDIKATVFIICAQFYYSLCNTQFDKTQTRKIIVRIHTGLCSL